MKDHQTSITEVRTGYCATCTCRWIRWAATPVEAALFGVEHKTKFEKKERAT